MSSLDIWIIVLTILIGVYAIAGGVTSAVCETLVKIERIRAKAHAKSERAAWEGDKTNQLAGGCGFIIHPQRDED